MPRLAWCQPIELRFERVCRQLGLTLTPDQFNACAALELRYGLTFCVDFGYNNACCVLADRQQSWTFE